MRHLNKFNESHSDKNEAFYIIHDILLEFFDENGINSLPNEDKVGGEYDRYLSDGVTLGDVPMAYGYYMGTSDVFDASNSKTDKKIKSIGVWNIDEDRVYKLLKFIDNQRDRIRESTGYHVTTNDEKAYKNKIDIYINLISYEEVNKRDKEAMISDYTYQMKSFNLNNISDDKLKEAFDLLDKLFKL
jgi:hypothetical protein